MDRAEMRFDLDRPTRLVDLETDAAVLVEPSLVAGPYQAALDAFLAEIRDGCRQHHTDYRLVTTDQPIENVLGEFLLARARR